MSTVIIFSNLSAIINSLFSVAIIRSLCCDFPLRWSSLRTTQTASTPPAPAFPPVDRSTAMMMSPLSPPSSHTSLPRCPPANSPGSLWWEVEGRGRGILERMSSATRDCVLEPPTPSSSERTPQVCMRGRSFGMMGAGGGGDGKLWQRHRDSMWSSLPVTSSQQLALVSIATATAYGSLPGKCSADSLYIEVIL